MSDQPKSGGPVPAWRGIEQQDRDLSGQIKITTAMIRAGADVLLDLDGEAGNESKAEAVFRAMLAARS